MWEFRPDSGAERIALLSSSERFENLSARISDALSVERIRFSIFAGYLHPVTDCLRPEFHFPVDLDLGTVFYSGINGYRAQFYRSPADGDAANRLIIGLMRDLLVEAARRADFKCETDGVTHRMTQSQIERSLSLPSAKIWPAEDQELNPEFHQIMTTDPPLQIDISAERWLEFARMDIKNAMRGIRAPEIRALDIKGAFIDGQGNERIPENKVLRAYELHVLGST